MSDFATLFRYHNGCVNESEYGLPNSESLVSESISIFEK